MKDIITYLDAIVGTIACKVFNINEMSAQLNVFEYVVQYRLIWMTLLLVTFATTIFFCYKVFKKNRVF